jgi:hypothetical protein
MLTLFMAQRILILAIELLNQSRCKSCRNRELRKHRTPLVEIDSKDWRNLGCAENEIKLPPTGAPHGSRAVAHGTCPQSLPIASWLFEVL